MVIVVKQVIRSALTSSIQSVVNMTKLIVIHAVLVCHLINILY